MKIENLDNILIFILMMKFNSTETRTGTEIGTPVHPYIVLQLIEGIQSQLNS